MPCACFRRWHLRWDAPLLCLAPLPRHTLHAAMMLSLTSFIFLSHTVIRLRFYADAHASAAYACYVAMLFCHFDTTLYTLLLLMAFPCHWLRRRRRRWCFLQIAAFAMPCCRAYWCRFADYFFFMPPFRRYFLRYNVHCTFLLLIRLYLSHFADYFAAYMARAVRHVMFMRADV